jgi:hypothetical protein
VPEICSTILIAALDDEILNAIGDAIPGERFQLLAARGWGSLASLGDRSLAAAVVHHQLGRSEERRVGKECNPECRSRWSPYH